MRDTNGAVNISAGTVPSHATRKDYVDGLIKATVLANNAKLDTDAPSTYPLGYSTFSTTSNGFPTSFATVETTRTGIASRSFQTVTASNNAIQWVRAETAGDTWGAWAKSATDAAATGSVAGLMSAADKAKLDAAATLATANTLAYRTSTGQLRATDFIVDNTPSATSHATNKAYVDGLVTAVATAHQQALGPAGSIAQTLDRRLVTGTAQTILTSGTMHVSAVWLPKGAVVNSATYLAATVVTGLTNRWYALYDASRNLLRTTADNTAAWAAGTYLTIPFSSAYTVPSDGLYYLGICEVATTPTATRGYATTGGAPMNTAPIMNGDTSAGLTNAASTPAVGSSIASQANMPYAYVS